MPHPVLSELTRKLLATCVESIWVDVLQRYKLIFIPQATSLLDLGTWEFMASVISFTLAGQILDTGSEWQEMGYSDTKTTITRL